MVRYVVRSSVALAPMAGVAIAGDPQHDPSRTQPMELVRYRIEPGAIHRDASGLISGTITLTEDPGGDFGKKGGGCLLYEPVAGPEAKGCANTSDCGGPNGYCAISFFTGNLPTPIRKCWYKQSECGCFKSPDVDLPVGAPISLPHIDPKAVPGKVRWRIITCQNITTLGCAGGAEGKNKRTRFGPIWTPPS